MVIHKKYINKNPILEHGIVKAHLPKEILYFLEDAELCPRIYHLANTGSCYYKFDDERLGNLRLADHSGKSKYKYRWNLRLDLKKSETFKDKGKNRFYYTLADLPKMIKHMKNYLIKIQKNTL